MLEWNDTVALDVSNVYEGFVVGVGMGMGELN